MKLKQALLTALAAALFAAPTAAYAGNWVYRHFQLPKKPISDHGGKAAKQVYKNLQTWLNGYGPTAQGIRLAPAVNGIHAWVRQDNRGTKWTLHKVGTQPFRPSPLTKALKARRSVLGGFVRIYEPGPPRARRRHGQFMDTQWFYRLETKSRGRPGNWVYTHKRAGARGWQRQIEDWINSHGAANASSIQGGLSAGKDFHLWVRKDGRKCRWKLVHEGMPKAGSHHLMNGKIRAGLANGSIAPLGFNRQSRLWYAKRISCKR
jgi:hypothetical protein